MLVLLPPSEAKAASPRRGTRLDLAGLSFPGLTEARSELIGRLAAVSARPDAAQRLDVGASLLADIEANLRLLDAPTLPVAKVFTGVLYDALHLPSLDPAARRRAARQVVVFSALWGALRPGDRVPPYRLPVGADLPELGGLPAWWRPRLDAALLDLVGRSVVVDCRSAGYAAMWTPRGASADRWVAVRVLREMAGRRSVVSHLAKLTRGQLVRHLLQAGRVVATPQALARVAAERFEVELTEPERRGRPWTLDVVLREA